MNIYQEDVEKFHAATGSTVGDYPYLRDRELRAKLIMEEAVETVAAMGFHASALIDEVGIPGERGHREIATFTKHYADPDFPEVIDGICDLIFVALGTAVAAGIDLDPFWNEVVRTNMEKLKGPKRADGKQLKPEGWKPPDILGILLTEEAMAS